LIREGTYLRRGGEDPEKLYIQVDSTGVNDWKSGEWIKYRRYRSFLRIQKRGKSWNPHRENPLLEMRLLKLNGEWNTYWNQRKEDLSTIQLKCSY